MKKPHAALDIESNSEQFVELLTGLTKEIRSLAAECERSGSGPSDLALDFARVADEIDFEVASRERSLIESLRTERAKARHVLTGTMLWSFVAGVGVMVLVIWQPFTG